MNGAADGISGDFLARIDKLNRIGIALSSEKDINRLLETILISSKDLTDADAGTLYSKTDHDTLKFEIIRTDSLNIAMGGTTGVPIPFPELPLYPDGQPNLQMIAAYAVLKEQTVNIPDAYEAEGFDFSGARAFDVRMGYRSTSFLTVPLKNHENEIIAVLQLINAKDPLTGAIRPFTPADQQLAESLASQAAIALTNQRIINNLKELIEAFIKSIAGAIDDKSPYTGGHCYRVPVLAEMLGRAASESDHGPLKDFQLSEETMYELKIAAWLHDCGKVTTPEYVVDKATKLEAIYDRLNTINACMDTIRRDLEIAHLQRRIQALEEGRTEDLAADAAALQQQIEQLESDRAFIKKSNTGGEFMTPEDQQRVKDIAQRWQYRSGADEDPRPLLNENEIYNLSISRGTLNNEERTKINHHVVATSKMLNALPFPKHLRNVPEIASNHHEMMNGKGYPCGITGDQMSIQARIMAIADVFEALTARDRPYKKGKPLSESIKILGFMSKDGHIDPDLFQIFIDQKLYLEYAEKYLNQDQIDDVDPLKIPGYKITATPAEPPPAPPPPPAG
ncbi:MAG: GAF domain-containing protein [Magnetococcales bacterium]|nr:GAF domain-containing protein [Magnetococcales bacterium]